MRAISIPGVRRTLLLWEPRAAFRRPKSERGTPMRWSLVLMLLVLVISACTRAGRPSLDVATVVPAVPSSGGSVLGERRADNGSALGRFVVREAEVTLECGDYRRAAAEIQRKISDYGGYVAEADISDLRGSSAPRFASLTVLVPEQRLQSFLSDLAAVGGVERVASQRLLSRDVTEETIDLAARRRALEATEQRMLDLLNRAQTIDEVLRVEQEPARVRTELEQLAERARYLERRTTFAEVRLSLVPTTEATEPSLGQTARQAWQTSLALLRIVLRRTVWISVALWWIWCILIVAFLVLAVFWRGRAGRLRRVAPE